MGSMVRKIGIIGLSEGNGHPFSFSSIINGYNDGYLKNSGWDVIYNYVRRRDPSEFGIEGFQITHAWTQDEETTQTLCKACLIPNSVSRYEDMIGHIDAVIIARDDYEYHYKIAKTFLDQGIPVFVDKPLSLNVDELKYFKPFLENGMLMSCSGMRYAREIDQLRQDMKFFEQPKLIRGTVINTWEKYGIHLIDAILSLDTFVPESVTSIEADFDSMAIRMTNGVLVQIDSLGTIPKAFHLDVYGTENITRVELNDNFSMFRRTMWHFLNSVENRKPAINANITLNAMRILIAGQISKIEKRRVFINELQI